MDGSPLNDIPAELRNRIYELALLLESPIQMFYKGGRLGPFGMDCKDGPSVKIFRGQRFQQQLRGAISLISSCKRIRQEALPVFYGGNEFIMRVQLTCDLGFAPKAVAEIPHITTAIDAWLQSLGSATRKHIRNFTMTNGVACFLFDEHGDEEHVIRLVPILLERVRTAMASTQAKPIFGLNVQWCQSEDETINDIDEEWEEETVTLSFQDATSAREAYARVFSNDETMVEESWGVWDDSGEVARPSPETVASRHRGLKNTRQRIELLIAELGGKKQHLPSVDYPGSRAAKAFKKLGA